ncbi:MAG TPA: glycosyltransferase family 1 protein [Candidatus Acidoferrales bacterium]
MRIGVIARRLLGQPFGIGRYMQYLLKYWNEMALPPEKYILFVPELPGNKELQLSSQFEYRVVRPAVMGVFWENLVMSRHAGDVDVLFCPSYTAPLFFYKGRLVVATHSVNEAQPGAHPWWYKLTYTPWYRWSAQKADCVIVPSESTLRDVKKHYRIAAEKIDIVIEGADEIFQPLGDPALVRQTRQRFFGSDRPYLLFVGKMSQRRNIPNLMTAFAQVKKRHNIPHGLLLFGPNILNLPLEQMARDLGIADSVVQTDGKVNDHREVVAVYNAADMYVYPSSYDGFSLTVVEAMASGLPVVTVDRAALREIAGNGAALLMNEPTVEELTASIERVLLDPVLRDSLRCKGLERARALTLRETARGTLDVIRRVGGNASGATQ